MIDAVDQFVNGNGWSDPINSFIQKNGHKFSVNDAEEYDVEQYDIFLQFGSLVEGLVEGIVKDLGFDNNMLVNTLQSSLEKESSCTRDVQLKTLLDTLLANDSFTAFHTMMLAGTASVVVPVEEPLSDSLSSAEYILQEAVARSLLEAQVRSFLYLLI